MAANTAPIFSALSALNFTSLALGSTDASMTSGNSKLLFTAGANGAFIDRVLWTPRISNQANEVVAGRLWINNGQSTNTIGNNALLQEVTLVKTQPTSVAANTQTVMFLGYPITPLFQLWITLSSTVLAGYDVTCVAGNY